MRLSLRTIQPDDTRHDPSVFRDTSDSPRAIDGDTCAGQQLVELVISSSNSISIASGQRSDQARVRGCSAGFDAVMHHLPDQRRQRLQQPGEGADEGE